MILIGDHEVEFHQKFKLFLQTKLTNPHFKLGNQAQIAVFNFTVTLDGLEKQLLGNFANHEKEGLEEQKAVLIRQMNEDKITMKELEDDLLTCFS
jgi:dynein heavy chain